MKISRLGLVLIT